MMPFTGTLNQENPRQDVQEDLVDNGQAVVTSPPFEPSQASDNAGTEVSSTTVDPDPSVEEVGQASGSEPHAEISEAVQSTSSMEVYSDSLDGFKDQAQDLAAKSSTVSNQQNSKGFQDAFAAFASASLREEEQDKPMVTPGSNEESKQETVVAAAADSAGSSGSFEPLVSSAIDSGLVTTSGESSVSIGQDADSGQAVTADLPITEVQEEQDTLETKDFPESENHPAVSTESGQVSDTGLQSQYTDPQAESGGASDSVYFIQMTDESGQIVTSIIDPSDIPSYSDSVVYKQCMKSDGEIETTIVYSGGVPVTQEEQQTTAASDPQQGEQQIIYAHDLNGQLTPIDSSQSANDVAPPGKQFVYMQDSTGRIIRTIMDANQTMVPGQQVYYTQSEDGRIITSVMDSATAGVSDESQAQQSQELVSQQQQQAEMEVKTDSQQQTANSSVVGGTAGFNIDNSMSGLSMLAELSHLTAGQAPTASGLSTEPRTASSTDSNSMDMDEFRPVAMVTPRQTTDQEGVEAVSSNISALKVGETDSDYLDQLDQNSAVLEGNGSGEPQALTVFLGLFNAEEDVAKGQQESVLSKIVSEMKGELSHPSYTVSRDNLFVQWQNLDAMCWMDVVLIMLVYSPTLRPLVNLDPTHELASTLLITLLKANRQAQVLLQNLLKKSNGAEISSLQTGAGNAASMQDPKTSKLVCKENMDEIGKAINILYAMREKIWQALQPRLRCERGKHNSPVLVLPLLVREKPAIKQMFTMNYRYVFKCEECGYSQDDSHTKILPSIPAVPADFNMKAPCFVRNCFECQAPNQRMLMKFEGLQDFVQMHFVKGLPHNRFEELGFDFNGDHYEVTAVVHYKNNPDHFIAWVRNAPGSAWMECDDLKSVITRYLHVSPNIPPSQVHLVMWERRLTPKHTLVMRDTEDTKLLASLVLTVQQPTSHQSTDPAAKPTGVPSGQATNSQQSSQASTLLSGLMNQTQTFSPYTPRGRGRGRGSRGSYGTRGRGALVGTNIRKTTPPTTTQISSPTGIVTTRPRTSPQIVRLPLSALQSSGLNLRGNTQGGARFVFVGNNSQSGSAAGTNSTGTPNKVVVVRSQGGSNNISASQLLQLLQRTGAISQTGSRISTTVTTTSATSTTSYVIQPDGTILTTATPTSSGETSTSQITTGQQSGEDQSTIDEATTGTETSLEAGSEQSTETLMETDQGDSEHVDGQLSRSSESGPQISTLPFSESLCTSVAATPSTNDATVLSPEAGTSGVQEATSPSKTVLMTGDEASGKVESRQQPSRYIQIPNPAGGGHILTQLVMRGGKMVLVPVDKNTQAQSAPVTSVLKLPNTPSASPKIAIRPAAASPQIITSSPAGTLQSQLLQQQQTVSTVSLSSGINTTTTATASPRFITIPSGAGGKRTIQLITVPRGSNSSQTGQKTIIMSPTGQASVASTAATTKLITTDNSEGRVFSKSNNIVIRELKRSEDGSDVGNTGLSTSLGSAGTSSDGSEIHLTSTPAVSLLRDVSARSMLSSTSGMTSLLTSQPGQLQKSQDSFKYILPGSSTTHILHTGPSATQGQAGRAFTALSSSGTIIGGQLTPAPTSAAIGTSPMDQDSAVADSDDSSSSASLLTQRRVSREFDTQEYIPLGRGRGRGRGGRGTRGRTGVRSRGRGGRTPRGAGRTQPWSPTSEFASPGTGKISTLSDLRQIGAHVIESGSEAVDGVPVVSIPEFSASQTEAMSAAESIEPDKSISDQSGSSLTDSLPVPQLTMVQDNMNVTVVTQTSQGPRVITQPIPSIKANHGFDILTQGILGSVGTARTSGSPAKQARSLLTGSPATMQSATSLLPTITTTTTTVSSTLDSSMSSTGPGLEQSLVASQSEIDTLIQAAQAAAKPSKPGTPKTEADLESDKAESSNNQAVTENDNVPADFLNNIAQEDKVGEDQGQQEIEEQTHLQPEEESNATMEERVVSVDDSHVSAAERYRMPMELFQPDEESPEKPVKTDEGIPKLGLELPSKLFQDSEISSVEEEKALSPFHQKNIESSSPNLDSSQVISPPSQSSADVAIERESQEMANVSDVEVSRPIEDMEIETSFKEGTDIGKQSNRKPRGRSKGHSSGKKGRRKSKSLDAVEPVESEATDASPVVSPRPSLDEKIAQVMSSPKKETSTDRSASKSPISGSVGGFAIDLLQEEDGKDKLEEASDSKGESDHNQDSSNRLEDNETVESMVSQVDDFEVEKDEVVKMEEKESSEDGVSPMKIEKLRESREVVFLPAFVPHKKHKADWNVDALDLVDDSEVENVDVSHSSRPFSYRVLTGLPRKPTPRHPSLGPVQTDFRKPPSPVVARPRKVVKKPSESTPAVVNRRKKKPLQRPAVDPSKEPTVIPLVADESDPACTGGSVVTSPDKGEIFTGVIVKHKREAADWSYSVEEDESEVIDNLTGTELLQAQRKYCKQLLTVYYMQAGDFSLFLSDDGSEEEEQEQLKEEETDSVMEDKKIDPKPEPSESEMAAKIGEAEGESKPSFDKGKQKKRGRPSLDSPNTGSKSKRAKKAPVGASSKEKVEDPTLSPSQSDNSLAFDNSSTGTRINGISSVASPTHSCQEPSNADISHPDTQKEGATAPVSMPSPSRRSGRTPIPSKRVLDAWEDTPTRPTFKDRRGSFVSSDEEQSLSGSDVSSKKAKQKTSSFPS